MSHDWFQRPDAGLAGEEPSPWPTGPAPWELDADAADAPDDGAGDADPEQWSPDDAFMASFGIERDEPPAASPLPAGVRGELEQATGADLGDVRLHTGFEATSLTTSHDADAVAVGRDIYFDDGALDLEGPDGRHLLAHEVAHTVQQSLSGPLATSVEHEADAFADGFAVGATAAPLHAAPHGPASRRKRSSARTGGFEKAARGHRLDAEPGRLDLSADVSTGHTVGIAYLRNSGDGAIRIGGLVQEVAAVSGVARPMGDFRLADLGGTSVPAGGAAPIVVTFQPQVHRDADTSQTTRRKVKLLVLDDAQQVVAVVQLDGRALASGHAPTTAATPKPPKEAVATDGSPPHDEDYYRDTVASVFRTWSWRDFAPGATGPDPVSAGAVDFVADLGNAEFDYGFLLGVNEGAQQAADDLVEAAKVLWKVLTGRSAEVAYDLYKTVDALLDPATLKGLAKHFADGWTNPDAFERGEFRGKVIGYLVAQIVIAIVTDGVAAEIKATGFYADVLRLLKGTGAIEEVGAVARTAVSTGPKPKPKVLEVYSGPSLDSARDLAQRHPEAQVIAAEGRAMPSAEDIALFREQGGEFLPERFAESLPPGSVKKIYVRYPLAQSQAMEAAGPEMVRELSTSPGADPLETLGRVQARAETMTNLGPHALEKLEPGGTMEVLFYEKEVGSNIMELSGPEYMDPLTGERFRLEITAGPETVPRSVAPKSGYAVPAGDTATQMTITKVRVSS